MKYKELFEKFDPEKEVGVMVFIDIKYTKLLGKLFLTAVLIVFSFFMSIKSLISIYNTYF